MWVGVGRVARTLDLGLDVVNGVRRLHLEGDSLPRQGFDEDLHLDEGLERSLVGMFNFETVWTIC